jgi:hypothetical protein
VPSYVVTWRQNAADSVSITLDQSQSSPTVFFYETPIPVKITFRNNTTQMVTLNNTFDLQTLKVPTTGFISRIDFDPEKWILTQGVVSGLVSNMPKLYSSPITLFPNPAATGFTIQGLDAEVQSVRLLDLSGREVALIGARASTAEYKLPAGVAAGSYSVQVQTKEGRISLPLIIVR